MKKKTIQKQKDKIVIPIERMRNTKSHKQKRKFY